MKILVIDDNEDTARMISENLRRIGHDVGVAGNINSGVIFDDFNKYDLIIVVRMLPHLNGLNFLRSIISVEFKAPVLFLMTMASYNESIHQLDSDRNSLNLSAALSALPLWVALFEKRRFRAEQRTSFQVADLHMNLVEQTVSRRGQSIKLTSKEFDLLEYLMRHVGEVVTRSDLLLHVWSMPFDPGTKVVENNIQRLRKKIDTRFDQKMLHTIRQVGYCLHVS